MTILQQETCDRFIVTFPKFILGSSENRAAVVALLDWFMRLMPYVHIFKKTFAV